jgi:hypothetical protein
MADIEKGKMRTDPGPEPGTKVEWFGPRRDPSSGRTKDGKNL